VVLDHVQFEKNSFINRNKLRIPQGTTWLTVPVKTSERFGLLEIDRVETCEPPNWRRKHWDTIRFNYCKTPYYKQYAPYLEALYRQEWPYLAPLLLELITWQVKQFGIHTPLISSREMGVEGQKGELVLNLCKYVGAKKYLSGPFGRNYLDVHKFEEAGIAVVFHEFVQPTYTQSFPGFEPYLSALDFLMNTGPSIASLIMDSASRISDFATDAKGQEKQK